MNKEQEQIQFLGFIGIFKESIKIILSHPKIFTKISIAFILPYTLIALANVEITKFLSNKVNLNRSPSTLNTQIVSPPTYNNNGIPSLPYSNWILFWVYKAAYIIFSLIFSLLSISVVVYTVVCIYTGKEITFKKVMSVLPKVWKRLMITLVSNFCIIFAYIFVILLCSLIFIFSSNLKQSDIQVGTTIITIVMVILIFLGVIYMAIFWQLANVISIMEKYCGFQAMKKSKQLIKGKLGTAIAITLVLSLCSIPIVVLHQQLVQRNSKIGIELKILYGILSFVLNPLIVLVSLVVQTIFYFVCKSYHHENINKSSLANHLEAFHGGYVPLMNGDIEIERLDV